MKIQLIISIFEFLVNHSTSLAGCHISKTKDIMTIFFEEYVDKRAMKYPFLQTPHVVLGYIGLYLFAIVAGKKIMANRQPYDLKTFVTIYNIVLVGICGYISTLAFAGGFKFDYFWRCYGADHTGQKAEDFMMISFCYFSFLSKAVELTETIVFVLRKKNNQVSFLHVYHHVSTLLLSWYFARSMNGGMQIFAILLNQMVHVVMYSYYLLSSLGPTVQRKLTTVKKYITAIQITQMCLITINAFAQLVCEKTRRTVLWFYIPNVIFILCMFTEFFVKNYLGRKKLQMK